MADVQECAKIAENAGWRVDMIEKVIRAPQSLSLKVRVYDIYALSKLAVFKYPHLGPPAIQYAPEPFPWQFALREGWEIEKPEYLRGDPLFDCNGRILVEDCQPRRIAFWEIEQFAEARYLDVAGVIDDKTELVLVPEAANKKGENRFVKEREVKAALHLLLDEPYVDKDNPTEMHDLFSSRVLLGGVERDAAFLLKGPGVGGPTQKRRSLMRSNVDKNGTQIERLMRSQPADILILQYVGHISLDIRRFLDEEAERLRGSEVKLCIIDGWETARLLALRDKKFPR